MEDISLHRDLRSHEKAQNRQRKQLQKYYGYRGVKPSWINQKYYTLVLAPTSEDAQPTTQTHASRKSRKSQTKHTSKSHRSSLPQIEHQNPQESDHSHLPQLSEVQRDSWWLALFYDNYVSLCASEARANNSTLCAPASLALVNDDLLHLPPGPDISPPTLPPNTTAALSLRTWTKHDNFAAKDSGIWPLDRRHHRGKRYREKRNRKESAKQLGHGHGHHGTPRPVDEQPQELDFVIRRHGNWDDGECCERCMVDMDVDDHLDVAFQDPLEFRKAHAALKERMKIQRLAEGDANWMVMFGAWDEDVDAEEVGREREMEDAVLDEGSIGREEVIVSFEADAAAAAEADEAFEDDGDAWSEVSSCPSMTRSMSVGSDYDVVFSEEGVFDGTDEVEWEILSTVVS